MAKITKYIFSWLALLGGIFSFFYMIYGTLCILNRVDDSLMIDIWLLLLIALVTIILGLMGLFGNVTKSCRLRSSIGVILGILLCIEFWIWSARLIEW